MTKGSPDASQRILVAGGAGFIGSHLVDQLLDAGNRVTVLDSFVTSTRRNLRHRIGDKRLRIVRQDVRLPLRSHFDEIYHLASPASPEDYWRRPVLTLLTNSVGTWRLLELARRERARFLLASTSEIYGDPLVHPQDEGYFGNVDPIGPRSAYDEGKRFAEAMTVAYVRAHDVDARIVRIFNTYGPRMRPLDGRMPSEFISAALAARAINVHGNGRQTRSLCYVTDTANGLRAAMRSGKPGRAYNIGRPDEISVMAFAKLVRASVGGEAPIRRIAGRSAEIRRRKPDVSRALRELGWKPVVSLDEGLRETIGWFENELRRRR